MHLEELLLNILNIIKLNIPLNKPFVNKCPKVGISVSGIKKRFFNEEYPYRMANIRSNPANTVSLPRLSYTRSDKLGCSTNLIIII